MPRRSTSLRPAAAAPFDRRPGLAPSGLAARPDQAARPVNRRPRRRPGHRLLRLWATSTVVLFVLGALWALASPVGSAPDEPTQVVKSAAVVRGQFIGSPVRHRSPAITLVTVPASFADDAHLATCYAGRPQVTAGCAPHLTTSSRPVGVGTYVGRYPPLYYLLVGVPTLLWRGDGAVLAMRLLSALWAAALLGLALAMAATWSRSRLLVAALAVAVTPLAVFLAAAVNPSGFEIAAAVATWTGLLVLVLDHRRSPPTALVASTAAAACVLVLSRSLSPLWLVLVAVTGAVLVPAAVPSLWASARVRRALAAVSAVSVLAVVYVLAAHALAVTPTGAAVPRHDSLLQVVGAALGRTGQIMTQGVGTFGWLDTPTPLPVLVAWWAVVGLVVLAGLAGGRRPAAVVLGLLALSVVLPTGIMASHAHLDGLVWQARDGMPLYVGVPLVAGAVAGRRRGPSASTGQRAPGNGVVTDAATATASLDAPTAVRALAPQLTVVVVGVVAAAQFADFFWALRRYTVGIDGPVFPWTAVRHGWAPPVPALLLVVLAAVVIAAYGWWTTTLATLPSARSPVADAVLLPGGTAPRLPVAAGWADAAVDRLFPAMGYGPGPVTAERQGRPGGTAPEHAGQRARHG